MMLQLLRKNTQEHHQSKNDATTVKNMQTILYFLTVAYKNSYIYGKILIYGFEPL